MVFQYLNRERLNDIPDLDPMIDGVIDKGTVVALAAQPAAGKSFLAIDWACSYVTGRTWQGLAVSNAVSYPGDRPYNGKALYIAAEGARGLKHRVRAWEEAWQIDVPKDDFVVMPHPIQLGKPDQVELLCADLEAETTGLVVVDTVARCTLGMEENSATDMGRVVDALYRIREAMGPDGTVLAIHHLGKSGAVRGSSALLGGVDQLMKLTRDGDSALLLEDEKRKDNMELAPMSLTLASKFDSRIIESAGPEWAERNDLVAVMQFNLSALLPMGKGDLKAGSGLSDHAFLHALNRGIADGLIVSTDERNPRYSLSGKGLKE